MKKRSQPVRKSLSFLQLLVILFLGLGIILTFFVTIYLLNCWYLHSRADRPESTLNPPDNSLPNSETETSVPGKTSASLNKNPELTFFESLIKNNSEKPLSLPAAENHPTNKPQQKKADPPNSGSYTVQLASFQQIEYAEKLSKSLKKGGFSSFITSAQLSNGKAWHRVRVGNFSSREDAKRIVDKLQDSTNLEPMIVSIKKSE